ncbi:polyhydroxyalkanoate granule-associated phasin [Niveibacterium sp. SC-1]|uniref:polyhydroxyalkanoate granule-associated phasin n=1 Tax=Niveibacterium sp. SC-1 TaxID=3135646 RepID=UPI00311F678D
MPYRRANASAQNLAQRAFETYWAAPQVVTHRLLRMAAAGDSPTARDKREYALMSNEKIAAFHESWSAMGLAFWRAQQRIAMSMFMAFWAPWLGGRGFDPHRLNAQWQNAMLGVLNQGLKPVHRRAVANARRLRRS